MNDEVQKELKSIKIESDDKAKKVHQTSQDLSDKHVKNILGSAKTFRELETETLRIAVGTAGGFGIGFAAGAKIGTWAGIPFGPVGMAVGMVIGGCGTAIIFRPKRRKLLEEQRSQQQIQIDIDAAKRRSILEKADAIITRIKQLPSDAPQYIIENLWTQYHVTTKDLNPSAVENRLQYAVPLNAAESHSLNVLPAASNPSTLQETHKEGIPLSAEEKPAERMDTSDTVRPRYPESSSLTNTPPEQVLQLGERQDN